MNNGFDSFIIKFLYLFWFNKILRFDFKTLVKFFYKLSINKIMFSSINIDKYYSLNFIS